MQHMPLPQPGGVQQLRQGLTEASGGEGLQGQRVCSAAAGGPLQVRGREGGSSEQRAVVAQV